MQNEHVFSKEVVGRSDVLHSQSLKIRKMEEILSLDGRNVALLRILSLCHPLITSLLLIHKSAANENEKGYMLEAAFVESVIAIPDFYRQKNESSFGRYLRARLITLLGDYERTRSFGSTAYSLIWHKLRPETANLNRSLNLKYFDSLHQRSRSVENHRIGDVDVQAHMDNIDRAFTLTIFSEEELSAIVAWHDQFVRKAQSLLLRLPKKSDKDMPGIQPPRAGWIGGALSKCFAKLYGFTKNLNLVALAVSGMILCFGGKVHADFDELIPKYDQPNRANLGGEPQRSIQMRSVPVPPSQPSRDDLADPNEPYFVAYGIGLKNAGKKAAEEVRIESAQSLNNGNELVSNTAVLNNGKPILPEQHVALPAEGIYRISFFTTNRENIAVKRSIQVIVTGAGGVPTIEILKKAAHKGELPIILVKSPNRCEINFMNQFRFGDEVRETPFAPVEDSRSIGPRSVYTIRPRKSKVWPESESIYIGYENTGKEEKVITRVILVNDVLEGEALTEWRPPTDPVPPSGFEGSSSQEQTHKIPRAFYLIILAVGAAGYYLYRKVTVKKYLPQPMTMKGQIAGTQSISLPDQTSQEPMRMMFPFWHNKLITSADSVDPDIFAIDDINGRRLYLSQLSSSINKGNSFQFVLEKSKGVKLPETKKFFIKQSARRARPLLCTYDEVAKQSHYRAQDHEGTVFYIKGERRNGKTLYSVTKETEGTYCFQPYGLSLKIGEDQKPHIVCLDGFKVDSNIEFLDNNISVGVTVDPVQPITPANAPESGGTVDGTYPKSFADYLTNLEEKHLNDAQISSASKEVQGN